jgi:hypothetical protein
VAAGKDLALTVKRLSNMPSDRHTVQTGTPPSVTEWRPVPDPTVLTTQQLSVAIAAQRDLFETRIEAMDTAVKLLQENANRSPTIGEVYARFEERFIRIDQSFVERDKRTDQLTLASSTAIAAALQAQKEAAGESQKSSSAAIAKAETATSESIKQLQVLFQTSIAALSTQILDVKSRLDKGEGQGVGRLDVNTEIRGDRQDRYYKASENSGYIAIAISVIAVAASVMVSFLVHFTNH